MEIKTLSSAIVLTLLAVGPNAMAMEGENQAKNPVIRATPAVENHVIEEGKTTGVSPTAAAKEETEAKVPYCGPYNLWGLLGSSASEPEKKAEAPATTVIAASTEEEKVLTTPATTAQEPLPEAPPEVTVAPAAPPSEAEKEEAPAASTGQQGTASPLTSPVVSAQEKETLSWLEWLFGPKKEKSSAPVAVGTNETQIPTEGEDPSKNVQPVDPDATITPALTESIMGLSKEVLNLIQDQQVREQAAELQAKLLGKLLAAKNPGDSSKN